MNLVLTTISLKFLEDSILRLEKRIVLYCDFNVANYFYNKNSFIDKQILLCPDSTAIYLALKLFYKYYKEKLVSTDLQDSLLHFAAANGLKVFFFGDSREILKMMKKKLLNKYPKLIITGCVEGYEFNNKKIIETVNRSTPHILFVGLGVGRQEDWIINNYEKLNANLIISVGGWFQFLSGAKLRAPKLLRQMSMEWVFKIAYEFKRVSKRYILGVPQFFFRVLTKQIRFTIKDIP